MLSVKDPAPFALTKYTRSELSAPVTIAFAMVLTRTDAWLLMDAELPSLPNPDLDSVSLSGVANIILYLVFTVSVASPFSSTVHSVITA